MIIRQLLVMNNLGGRGIESRRQLSFAERTTLTREAKTNWKQNEKRRARGRPLTRERARTRRLDRKLLRGKEGLDSKDVNVDVDERP